MRSLFTPSRLTVLVTTLTLISFLWTYGLPNQLAEPSLPIIEHLANEAKLYDPMAPAPVIRTSHVVELNAKPTPTLHGNVAQKDDDHRWDVTEKQPSHVDEQTPLFGPKETGPDGGRWNDGEKAEKSGKVSSSAASTTPESLLESSSSANSTSATATPITFAPYVHTAAPVKGFCKDVRRAQDVMVVVKTSKAEIFEKLSGHLFGLLSCVPNFAIFSDHAGRIDDIPVHDALHDISPETQEQNDEFREYKIMKADPEYKPDAKKTKDLDKWKILTMVYDAYKINPHARFYAFIEADTGLSWTNLLQWVDRLDYRIPYYNGAQTAISHVQFAQRGPGILLSQGALRQYARSYEERWATRWEKHINKECCGDYILATALNDAHIELYKSWPLMQGERPNTLDYSPKQWCTPAVSWHHMDNDALKELWSLQTKWTDKHGWERPYLYRDAYEEYVQPHLKTQIEDWDNLSSDTEINASDGHHKGPNGPQAEEASVAKEKLEKAASSSPHRRDEKKENKKGVDGKETANLAAINTIVKDGAVSSENCRKVCLEVEDCLQWRHTTKDGGKCYLSKVIRLGKAAKKEEGAQQWVSGWMVERIKESTSNWLCREVNWKFYQ